MLKKLLKLSIIGNKAHQPLILLNWLEVIVIFLLSQLKLCLRFLHDMVRVLERLTTPKALIDMVRRHGVEEFHGISLEESERAEFWLEKLQRVLVEVRCPPEQRVSCAISLMQNGACDWWKLVLRHPWLPDLMPWDFFV